MGDRKLYKSSTDKMIGGVCGGLGEYFNVDPTVLRIAWVGIALITLPIGPAGLFIGGLAYLACWLIIPSNPNEAGLVETQELTADAPPPPERDIQSNSLIWGIVLVLLALVVLSNMDGMPFALRKSADTLAAMFFMALVVGGAYWMIKHRPQMTEVFKGLTDRKLYRSTTDKKIFGVCGGLAESFEIDPTLVRLGWAFAAMLTGGTAILIYLVMAFVMPVGRPDTGHWS
jgi:phage shock protein PspC (stress-responsive transcriptional regulator)